MPSPAHAQLEELLRARHLDRTLTTHQPASGQTPATGISAIDDPLGGGFPYGQLSELVGLRSTGRTTVLHAVLAAATERGALVAIIDSLDTFDPSSASEAGVDLERMLWVRGPSLTQNPRCAPDGGPLFTACQRAIKAFNLVLQARGFGLVVLDLADMPIGIIRRLPFITWLRLQRVLEGRETAGLLVADGSLGRSAHGVTLHLTADRRPAPAQQSWWEPPPFELFAQAERSARARA